jgi:hypothetical protein
MEASLWFDWRQLQTWISQLSYESASSSFGNYLRIQTGTARHLDSPPSIVFDTQASAIRAQIQLDNLSCPSTIQSLTEVEVNSTVTLQLTRL